MSTSNYRTVISLSLLAILLLPMAAFIAFAIHFSLNIPLYDDITQILWITNTFLEGSTSPGTPDHIYPVDNRLHALFYPNAGHIPMVTRVIGLLLYYLTGNLNFATATVLACLFWVATVLLLLYQAHKDGLSLFMLIPIPFLLFSLIQWEAMTMMLGGVQMYVGTLFFPIVTFYALTKNRVFSAATGFFLGLFASGGALAVFPIGVAYLLLQRRWLHSLIFFVLCGLSTKLFMHLNIFLSGAGFAAALSTNLPNKIDMALQFMGNIFTDGNYGSDELVSPRFYTGIVLSLISLAVFLGCPGQHLFKLSLMFVFALAGMTALNRANIAPRYSVFSLLAISCIYVLMINWLRPRLPQVATILATLATTASIWLWVEHYAPSVKLTDQYHTMRIEDMQNFLNSGNAQRLLWDPAWCIDIFTESKRLGVFDYTQSIPETSPAR